jgi:diguanylate cyclase (GGDEF)-like protein
MTARDPIPATLPAADTVFSEIAELAAQLCGAAFAAITLREDEGHRAVATAGGLDLGLLPRDTRFCCEVLHSGAPLEVSDASFDLRFHDDPFVCAGPRIRFYSGVPLLSAAGEVIGTVSVLDPRPNVLTPGRRESLWKLADVVARLLADKAAREAAEADLSWQATHDALTELANRRQFEAAATRLLASARAEGRRHAVLFVDLDQFKVVNDACGHPAGDALLRDLAQLLAGRMRRADTLARLGGDEFGVLLEGCDLADAQRIAATVLAAIRDYRFSWEGRIFTLGASIGVAEITDATPDLESVLSAADTACYLAKDLGRNRIQVYRDDDEEVASRHGEKGWVAKITQGAEQGRFFLHAQRVVSLSGDGAETEYLELLLRMRDEQGRVVPPMAFIPAAERYHLMGRIDRWVVGKALGCLARIAQSGETRLPRFGINLSGMSLGDAAFAEYVLEQFDITKTPPDSVCFEITETAAISNLGRARGFINRFRDLGCRFALDDFGSGLSSFEYLKSLPVDYLKIEGSFVRGLIHDRIDRAVVDAIQRLARAAGARTIAESVESAAVAERLRALGIDFGQGYVIHTPEPYAAIAPRLNYPPCTAAPPAPPERYRTSRTPPKNPS